MISERFSKFSPFSNQAKLQMHLNRMCIWQNLRANYSREYSDRVRHMISGNQHRFMTNLPTLAKLLLFSKCVHSALNGNVI